MRVKPWLLVFLVGNAFTFGVLLGHAL